MTNPPPGQPIFWNVLKACSSLLHHPSGLQAIQNVPCRREKAVLGHQTRMASGDNCGCMPRKCRMPRIWSNMEQFSHHSTATTTNRRVRSLNFTKLRIYPISLALISAKYHVSLYRSHIGVICEQVWLLKTLPSGIWNEMQVLKSDEHKNLPPNHWDSDSSSCCLNTPPQLQPKCATQMKAQHRSLQGMFFDQNRWRMDEEKPQEERCSCEPVDVQIL